MTSTEKITAAAQAAGLIIAKIGPYTHEIQTTAGAPVGSFSVTATGELWGGFLRDPRGFTTEHLSVPSLIAAVAAR